MPARNLAGKRGRAYASWVASEGGGRHRQDWDGRGWGRRPWVVSGADRAAGLEIRRGPAVAGLVTGPSAHDGVPPVTGVRLSTGEELTADLVVDMTGRRSHLPRWLEAIGAQAPRDELDDCGFVYYGRHFRSADGTIPPALGGFLMHLGTISVLTLPADNGTWSVTLVTSAKDRALRLLREAAIWEKAVRALRLVAHWL